MLISIDISNRFDIVWNIQIVIRLLYHSFKRLSLLILFLFNGKIKSGKSFAKIGSCLQIDLLPRLIGSVLFIRHLIDQA